jgi:hypothetical protein
VPLFLFRLGWSRRRDELNTLGGREEELDLSGGKGRIEVVEEVGAGATDANVILKVLEVVEVEGAVPGEGAEVGGDDAEGALEVGVGVEEHGAARESIGVVVAVLRSRLAEDGGHPDLRRRRRRHLGGKALPACGLLRELPLKA